MKWRVLTQLVGEMQTVQCTWLERNQYTTLHLYTCDNNINLKMEATVSEVQVKNIGMYNCLAYLYIMEQINALKMKHIKIINLPVCMATLRFVFVFLKACHYVSLTSEKRNQIYLFFQNPVHCWVSIFIYWFFHVDCPLLYSDIEFRRICFLLSHAC